MNSAERLTRPKVALARLLLDERVEPDFATTLLRVGLPAVRVPDATAPSPARVLPPEVMEESPVETRASGVRPPSVPPPPPRRNKPSPASVPPPLPRSSPPPPPRRATSAAPPPLSQQPRASTRPRSTALARNELAPGQILLNQYVVERVVGKMGSSVVVKVRHARREGRFLLKYLAPEACSEPFAVERFLQTARAAVELQSEHTARTIDAGCLERGVPYLVTEAHQGTELREILRVRGSLGDAEAVDVVLQAAHAVSEAHRYGMAHGSLSPSTLFMTLGPDGRPMVKVLDFGSAATLRRDPFWIRLRRWTEGTAIFSESTRLWDTLACTAPERLRVSMEATVEGDVWALGAILYELLLGTAPFNAPNTPALMAAIAADRPPSARELGKRVPHELAQVVKRCLEKSPEARFESVYDIAQALRRFASPEGRRVVERIEHIQGYDPELSPWFAASHGAGHAAPAHHAAPARRPPLPLATSLLLAAIGAFAGVTLGSFVVRTLAAHDTAAPAIHQR